MWAPARNGGERVATRMNISFKFKLNNVDQKGTVEVGEPAEGYGGSSSSSSYSSTGTKQQVESEKVTYEKSETLFNFGVKNFGEGKYTKAKHYFDEVIKIKPDDKNARYNLALTKVKLDDLEGACEELDKLVALN